jgi:DNA-binding NarL/FixJ family response regulator
LSVRILLADDHAETRQATRILLAGHPEWLICGEVDNGLDAVEKAATLKPDLVILDLSMPKMNGLEAAKIIHTASPSLPLLLFSINGRDVQTLEDVRTAGFRGVVPKTAAWMLPEAIEMVLQGKTFLNSAALGGAPLVEAEAVADALAPSADEPASAKIAAAGADDPSGKPPVA